MQKLHHQLKKVIVRLIFSYYLLDRYVVVRVVYEKKDFKLTPVFTPNVNEMLKTNFVYAGQTER